MFAGFPWRVPTAGFLAAWSGPSYPRFPVLNILLKRP
jgi:hypothetical protein